MQRFLVSHDPQWLVPLRHSESDLHVPEWSQSNSPPKDFGPAALRVRWAVLATAENLLDHCSAEASGQVVLHQNEDDCIERFATLE
jgi:hypothetical protein